ncbi:hypothetical protein CXB51_009179 [Gossypium anomalum]|uniref:RNase H type-1 domain-containing protein n=1 Tax=Gossypium anomalum TaxID=47600 RepID=A0A8J6D2C6_9ROSI|nr:hypothetical protein CXB51_009179 [Gossypium anomalum]
MIVGQAETLVIHTSNSAAAELKEDSSRTISIKCGILRDSHGNWLPGFCRFIGRGSALTIELWAILHGLEIAWQKEYTKVIIVSDNKSAVDMLTDASLGSSTTTLVRRIKEENKYDLETIHFSMFDVSSLSHGGSEWIKPVILPLPRAGGVRCSVKPASRFIPLSKSHEAQAYARAPWSNSWLGTGKPESNHYRTDSMSRIRVPSP